MLTSHDARAGLILDSGLITVETNAVHDGTNEDPKINSAPRNTFPGDAQLSVQSQKIVGPNGMTSTSGAILQSRDFGGSFLLSGSAGPTARGFINNPTGAGTFVGTGRGTVTYTFTLTTSFQYFLSWLTSGEVKDSAGNTVNSPGNSARVRIIGVFEESITGSGRKEGDASGVLGPGTYTVEGIATASATNVQDSRANFFFGLNLSPVNRWINPAGGVFQIPGNWEAGTVPGGQEGALIDLPGTYTIALSSDVSHGALQMHGSGVNVTLELGGDSYTLSSPLQVGGSEGDSVFLTVQGSGGIISAAPVSDASIPANAPTTGGDDVLSMPELTIGKNNAIRYLNRMQHISQLATIEGSWALEDLGTFVEVSQLKVGVRSNIAKVELSKNAQLLTGNTILGIEPDNGPDPEPRGLISLAGAAWQVNGELIVGKAGDGEVNVTSKGKVTVEGPVTVAADLNSSGLIKVDGEESVFESQSLLLGPNGNGALEISNAARVVTDTLRITSGFATATDVTRLTVKENLILGHGLQSAAIILNGGSLNVEGSLCPIDIGNQGTLGIDGGSAGFTTFKVRSGGLATVENGTLDASDAAIDSAGEVKVRGEGTFDVKSLRVDGTLTILGTGAVKVGLFGDPLPGSVRINPGGLLTGAGTIVANEIVLSGGAGNQFTGTQIRPGTSPGILTLNGNYRQESGTQLIMEIAGTSADAHDQLVITGNANLGGTLVLQFLDGFVPSQGDQFALLDIGGAITGDFESVEIVGLEPGFEFDVLPDANGNLVLTALNDGVPQQSKGKYRGLLLTDPSVHTTAGFFNIQVTPRHSFSAKFVLGGETFKVKGKFDSDGKFTGTATGASGTSVTVNLVLSLVNDERAITGTITIGNQTIALAAEQTKAFNKKTNPAPQAGKYTLLLPFDPQDADAPKANGYGLVTVAPTGAIRFAGALPDGTRLSQATVLSRSGQWPFYLSLYSKGGSLAGLIQFQDLPGSDFDGLLHWTRPADAGKEIPGFVTTLAAVGSSYLAPPTRPAVLDFPNPNGATFTLNDPNQTLLLSKTLTLAPPARFTVTDPGPDALSLSVKPASGLLSGRLIHPSDDAKTKLQGVVFQKQNFGSGFAPTSTGPASFELRANP